MSRALVAAVALAACLVAACGAGEAFQFSDDFGRYPAHSDGGPTWDTTGIEWEAVGGQYLAADRGKSFAVVAKAPYAKRVAVDATVVLRKAAGTEWKTAGVAIVLDARNYWHFAFVEEPDEKGRGHFVELCEMLDGVWLSQTLAPTRLTELESLDWQVAWQYNHPYRLRIEMTEQEIAGTLSELGGKVVARKRYKLDNKAVTWGRPALTSGGFAAAFDDVAARCEKPVPAPEQKRPTFPPYTQAGRVPLPDTPRGKATGFFHVEQHGDRWWVIDPKGRAFFVVGTDHANYRAHWCEKLGFAPYHRNMAEKFGGDEDAWAKSTAERLLAWGFNSLGAGHSPSLRGRGLAWMGFATFGYGFSTVSDICPKVHWTGFPNVFHPKFALYCDKRARQICAPHRDDPWLIGYFLDNELEWYGKGWRAWELCDAVFKSPPDDPTRQALIAFLRKRYPKVEQLNAAWGTKVESYEALAKATIPLREQTNQGRGDKSAFIRQELGWADLTRGEWSLTDEAFKKPPDHSAKQALIAFLKKRYPKIEQLNAAWGTAVASYDALARSVRPLQHKTDKGKQDKIDFLRLIAEKYFAITTAAIRKHDPNHMILGSRFAGDMPPVGDIAGKHCDIFTINCYRRIDLETEVVHGFEDDLKRWHAEVQRPFMITEWSFPALDSGLPCKHGAGMRVDTQAQKAQCFTIFQKLLFSTPFMVGSNYFMWVDEPALGISSTFPEDSNYGLVDVNNKPYKELTEAATRLNPQVYAVHDGRVPILSVTMAYAPWRAVVRNAGAVDARATLEVTRPGGTERRPIAVAAGRAVEVPLGEAPLEPPALLPGPKPAGTVRLARKGEVWTVDNGVLQLIKEKPGGNAFDRVLLEGKELGLFVPVIWQDVGQNLWPKAETARIVGASNGPARLELDIEFGLKGASTQAGITEVDGGGKFAPAARRPGAFRTCYRFYVYPGKPWFGARFLWIENADTRPWKLMGYFHYALSSLAGDASDDEVGGPDVPNYYRSGTAVTWFDPKAKLHYGITAGRPDDFEMQFWKNPAGGQHADVRREIGKVLKPGERYAEPQPTAYVFGAAGEKGSKAWLPIAEEIRRMQAVEVRVVPLRK